ncbi:Rad17 cell cycle checkpoint protein-domain-containing protein [Scheffersomyces amazonensis]|uniref:Rad17 cell cycle checkpoint protein-domain-containing protein n=1 Tax=Scheffersomyces amazonensis TaxID=1078765 RepID=UPI00315D82FA
MRRGRNKRAVITIDSDGTDADEESEDDLIEDIEDDEEEISGIVKRQPELVQPEVKRAKRPASIKTKTEKERKIKKETGTETETETGNQQWSDQYAPKSIDDICINPQKLKQVKEVLYDMIYHPDALTSPRILILSGPAGSSKSTTVKLLANDLIRSSQDNFGSYNNDKWIEYMDIASSDGFNQSNQFDEFMNDVKYRVGSNLTVVVLEELPNIFHYETLIKFRNKLREWLYMDTRLPPLVICLTEVEYNNNDLGVTPSYSYNIENNLTVDTLLGKELASNPKVKIVKFNSIANRYVRKTINNIMKYERKVFSQIPVHTLNGFLDELVKLGDIRSILFNLQLWARNYVQRKERGVDDETYLETSFIRENQINLFHAIGKIIYSSSEFANLADDKKDFYSIEQVLNSFNNSALLNLSILENYGIYQNGNYEISIASEIVDDLSLNDLMIDGEASKDFGIRSTRNKLRSIEVRSSSGYTNKLKIKFPRHFKMIRQYNKTMYQIKAYQRYVHRLRNTWQELNMIDGYYLPLIYNKKKQSRYLYNRLGGKFQEIYADEELGVSDLHGNDGHNGRGFDRDQFEVDIEQAIAELNNEEGSDDEEGLSDPIDDSIDELDENEDEDGERFSSDSELEGLISQGMI